MAATLEPIREVSPSRSLVRVLSDILLGAGGPNGAGDGGLAPLRAPLRAAGPADVALLDLCSLGPHGCAEGLGCTI